MGQGQTIEAQNSPGFPPEGAPPISDATPVVTPTPGAPAIAPAVSPRVAEIAKLVQSGVSEDVLIAFIKNSPQAFNPTADEILYLTDLGMPDTVLTVLMQHQPAVPNTMAPPMTVAPPAPAPVVVNPQQVVVTTNVIVNETRYVEAPQETVTTFYEPLRAYGSWVEVEDYGLCWQPTVVVNNRDWRPYSDRGHWVYTTAGWYWQSDYSWGWAPFHYGRWHSSPRFGWVWMPDRVWGPAWVSWRYNDDYCGWAPLPPRARFDLRTGFSFGSARVGLSFDFGLRPEHYNFVPISRFHDRSPNRFVVRGDNVRNVYNNTTVINNYTVKNNTTVINEGVGRERIAAATHTRITPVTIHQTGSASAVPHREVLNTQNRTLQVYRPPTDETRTGTRSGVSANASRSGRQEMIKLDAPIEKGAVPARSAPVRERPDVAARPERSSDVRNADAERRPTAGRTPDQGRNYPRTQPGTVNENNNVNSAPRSRVVEAAPSPAPSVPTARPVERIERPVAPVARNYPGADMGRAPEDYRTREAVRAPEPAPEYSRGVGRTENYRAMPAPEPRNVPEMSRTPAYTPPARTEPFYRPQTGASPAQSPPVYRSDSIPSHAGQSQAPPAYRAPVSQPAAPVYSAPSQNSSRGDVPPNYRPDNGGRKFRNDQ